MRYELHTQIEIDAPPETLWKILVDLDLYADWNPFVVEASGEVVVGQKLTNRLQQPDGKAMTFKPVVTVVEPARTFEWLGHLGIPGLFDGRHRFDLEGTSEGGTRLMHGERFNGVLVRPMRKMLETQTKLGFGMMNEALKARAEALAKAAI